LLVALLAGLALPGLTGCSEPVCSTDSALAVFQLSPSERVAAYIDADTFASVFDWLQAADAGREQSFGCLVERFAEAFSTDVDILLIVLDITAEEYFQRSTTGVIANFTAAQRIFETGLGRQSVPLLSPVGPPSMRSYTVLGSREGLMGGPLLHELAHGWSAFLDGPAPLAEQINREPRSHWGYTSVGGVLGGWEPGTLAMIEEGLYQACSPSPSETFSPVGYANNDLAYAPLELYLMGLVSAEEVPDIDVAVNPQPEARSRDCAVFRADGIVTVTIEDIIAANGQRRPSAVESPKNFRVGLVVLAEDWLETEGWAPYEEAMACMESTSPCQVLATPQSGAAALPAFLPLNFHQATGQRATLEFLRLEPRQPVVPTTEVQAPTPAKSL
jgi:hypothetical protein